jgi:hypothetical protein
LVYPEQLFTVLKNQIVPSRKKLHLAEILLAVLNPNFWHGLKAGRGFEMENPTLRKVGLDTASGWNDKPNVAQAPGISNRLEISIQHFVAEMAVVTAMARILSGIGGGR